MKKENYLYFGKSKIKYNLKSVLTGKLRAELINLIQENSNENSIKSKIEKAVIESPELLEIANNEMKLATELIKREIVSKDEYLEMLDLEKQNEKNSIYEYKFFQKIINTSVTNEEVKEILNQSVLDNLEFWENQDVEMITECNNSFRKRVI